MHFTKFLICINFISLTRVILAVQENDMKEDVPFVIKMKEVCNTIHFLLLQCINTTSQIKLVGIMVNRQDKSSITSQYLNNQKRQQPKKAKLPK